MIVRFVEVWKKFWFRALAPEHLGRVRAGFFCTLFILTISEPYASKLASFPKIFWRPVWIINVLISAPPSYVILRPLEIFWEITILASAFGFLTGISTLACSALGLFFIGLSNSYGVVSHGHTPVILCSIILALSSCGDGFSLDRWLRDRNDSIYPRRSYAMSGQYHWPIQLMRVVWCSVFFSAGVSKVLASGFAWISADNLQTLLLLAPYRYRAAAEASLIPGFGGWLAKFPILCVGIASFCLFIELLAPLALFSVRSAWLLILSITCMQVMIYFTLFENFIWFSPVYFAWSFLWKKDGNLGASDRQDSWI